ncbi:unnamed protein product [Gadus morhua 'NCC']
MCVVANTPASKYSGHRVGVSARGRHRVKAGRRGEGRGGTRKTLRSSDLTKPKNLEKHFHQKRGEDKREGEEFFTLVTTAAAIIILLIIFFFLIISHEAPEPSGRCAFPSPGKRVCTV